ncbi:uncharacterized protein LOC142645997 [Dermatophagoides pteronyssinus]|uniref:uncharacterized protein LOC142645997 n=1 Tax=Dermatophagoides pteronyssinus TaxID=6956 RepID=UPI003F67C63C
MFIQQQQQQQSHISSLPVSASDSFFPIPIELFDDQIIPTFILGTAWIFSCLSVIFLLYDIITTLLIRIVIDWNRKFWHLSIDLLRKNQINREKVIGNETAWTTDSPSSSSAAAPAPAPTAAPETKAILFGWNKSLLKTIHLRLNILKTLNKTLKSNQNNNNKQFDSTIVGHTWRTIFYLTDVCYDRHICRLCSIEKYQYDDNRIRRNNMRSLFDRSLLIGNHFICLAAIFMNYNQILFYIFAIFYLSMAIPLTWIELLVRTSDDWKTIHLRHKFCEYQRLQKLNNIIMLTISALNYIVFAIFFMIYIRYDSFILNMSTELVSNIY